MGSGEGRDGGARWARRGEEDRGSRRIEEERGGARRTEEEGAEEEGGKDSRSKKRNLHQG